MSKNINITESWQEVMETASDEVYPGTIVPFGEHSGGDPNIRWRLKSAMELVNLRDALEIPVIFGYSMKEVGLKRFIEGLGQGIDPFSQLRNVAKKGFTAARFPKTVRYLTKCKKSQMALVDQVKKHINSTQEVNITDFLVDELDRFISSWTGFMVNNREWKDRLTFWKEQYYYPIITYRDSENVILPETITIYINEDAKIRYSAKLYIPAVTQNTGNRIQCQSIYIASKVFGMMDKTSFIGMQEWLEAADNLPALEESETGTSEMIQDTFDKLTAGIRKGKRKLLIQDDTDKQFIAETIVIEILRKIVLQINSHSEWQKGLKETGRPWNSELIINSIRYDVEYEPDGMVTWAQHIERLESQIGYPVSGQRSWASMIDMRGEGRLEVIRFCGCGREEINGNWEGSGKGVDFIKIKAGEIQYYDEATKWYDLAGAKIFRDGTIKYLGDWNKQAVCLVTEIDEWIKVFYRTGPYIRPELRISLINHKARWQENLRKMGLDEKYNSMGYSFLFSGRALDVELSTISRYKILGGWSKEFVESIAEYAKGTSIGQQVENVKNTAVKITNSTVDAVKRGTSSTFKNVKGRLEALRNG